MYEIPQGWEAYYEELEKDERIEIFEQLLEELPDDGLNAFRKEVHEKRYPNPGKRGTQMDMFLLSIVYFPGIYSKKISVFGNTEKEIGKACKDLMLDRVASLSEEEKAILYLELHNAADLYFFTCNDAGYGRKMFGLVQAKDEERMTQVCSEAWILSKGIPKLGGKVEEMQLFSEAVLDAYYRFDRKAEKRLKAYEELMKQREASGKKGWFSK